MIWYLNRGPISCSRMRILPLETQCMQEPCSTSNKRPTVLPQVPSKRRILENAIPNPPPLSRRHSLALLSTLPALNMTFPATAEVSLPTITPTNILPGLPNYAAPGPLQHLRLPNLEHTCTTCDAPAERCRLKIHAWVPKGGGRVGLTTPFPLAIITPGETCRDGMKKRIFLLHLTHLITLGCLV